MQLSHRKKSFLIFIGCLVLLGGLAFGCGGGSDQDSSQVLALVKNFTGAESLTKQDDGSWLLTWNLVDREGILYGIYRAAEGEEFNFDRPEVTIQKNQYIYRPENVFTAGVQCFIVRVSNVTGDENESKLCTTDQPFEFTGLAAMERLSDGGYLLEWPRIPLDTVIYSVYESTIDGEFNFDQPSYDAINDNFINIPVVPRGEQICFVVRYSDPSLPADENTTSLCTDEEPLITFTGIDTVNANSSNEATVTWTASSDEYVTGYAIFQGSDFKELMGETDASENSFTITGLVPGRQYSFGVRATDEFAREDNNLVILSIVMPSE